MYWLYFAHLRPFLIIGVVVSLVHWKMGVKLNAILIQNIGAAQNMVSVEALKSIVSVTPASTIGPSK